MGMYEVYANKFVYESSLSQSLTLSSLAKHISHNVMYSYYWGLYLLDQLPLNLVCSKFSFTNVLSGVILFVPEFMVHSTAFLQTLSQN